MLKNSWCPKSQQMQSVKCSNVGKLTHAALIIERMQQCAALMIERTSLLRLGFMVHFFAANFVNLLSDNANIVV
jgi:hypothetical protein